MNAKRKTLNDLRSHEEARVSGFSSDDPTMVIKLREIGFAEGDTVEIMGRGLLGGTPVSVRLNQTLIALRAREARLVEVENFT